MSPGAERIPQFVKEKPGERLTALLRHITPEAPEALGEASHALKRDAAPGVDGMAWREYGDGLEERLLGLHARVQRGAYRAAPGVDGMAWREYGDGLEERLLGLHARVQRGAYRAAPVRRVEISKPDGGVRPLGIATLKDKIVQRAVLEPPRV